MIPQPFNVNLFTSQCSKPMPRSANDPHVDECIMWMGTKGSYNVIPSHLRNSVDKERSVNGKMRYFQDYKNYSARNVAFIYYRPNDVPPMGDNGDGKTRFRLKSLCNRPRCVNPWHHTIGNRRSNKKKPTKMADKIPSSPASPVMTPIMTDSAFKKTISGRVEKHYPPSIR